MRHARKGQGASIRNMKNEGTESKRINNGNTMFSRPDDSGIPMRVMAKVVAVSTTWGGLNVGWRSTSTRSIHRLKSAPADADETTSTMLVADPAGKAKGNGGAGERGTELADARSGGAGVAETKKVH